MTHTRPKRFLLEHPGRALTAVALIGLLLSAGTPTAHADESATSGEGNWLSYDVSGSTGATRVYDSGVPGGGQLLSFFQQPEDSDTSAPSRKLTITTDEPIVVARAANLEDGGMTPVSDAGEEGALKVSTTDGQTTVTLESTDEAQTIYLLPEQTPEAADPEDQNLLEKAWATVVSLITGDDEPTFERADDVEDHEAEKPSKADPTDTATPPDQSQDGDSVAPEPDACESKTEPTSTSDDTTRSQDIASSDRDPSSGPTGPASPPGDDCVASTTDDPRTDVDIDDPTDQDGSNAGSGIEMENAASGLPFMLGAAGEGVASGEYGKALGRDLDIAATWANDNQNMVDLPQLQPGGEYGDWDKALDISIGAIDQNAGETWAKAAAGAYDDRWTESLTNMRELRTDKDGTTYIRFAHEWNGSWFAWSVDKADTENFKEAWRHFAELAHSEYPEAKLVMSQNRESNGYDGDWTDAFPGNEYVDVMNVDYYNNWPYAASIDEFKADLEETDSYGGPKGLGAHLDYAASVGLSLSLGEWSGVQGDEGGDSPAFISGMFDFFEAHAGDGPGGLLYACQFNVSSAGNGKFNLLMGTSMPSSSDAFRELFGS